MKRWLSVLLFLAACGGKGSEEPVEDIARSNDTCNGDGTCTILTLPDETACTAAEDCPGVCLAGACLLFTVAVLRFIFPI